MKSFDSRNAAGVATACIALFVAGCSSPQMSRIDANRDIYETWDIEIKQAVLDGRVEPGMTPEMVEVAWGKPSEVISESHQEIWVYRKVVMDDIPIGAPVMGGSVGGTSMGGLGVSTGRGGTSVGAMGTGSMGAGVPAPMPSPPPVVDKEVVFRGGVVYRADRT